MKINMRSVLKKNELFNIYLYFMTIKIKKKRKEEDEHRYNNYVYNK